MRQLFSTITSLNQAWNSAQTWQLQYNVNLTNQASATTYKNAMPQSNNACTQALNARLDPTELTTRLTKLIKLTTCKCMQSKRTSPHRPHKSVDKTDKLTTCKCIQSKRTTWPHGTDKSVDKTHDRVGLMKLTTYILSKPHVATLKWACNVSQPSRLIVLLLVQER